jgi:hypothetical protein
MNQPIIIREAKSRWVFARFAAGSADRPAGIRLTVLSESVFDFTQ